MKQPERTSGKQPAMGGTGAKGEPHAKNTPPNDEQQFYNITTKIGYVSPKLLFSLVFAFKSSFVVIRLFLCVSLFSLNCKIVLGKRMKNNESSQNGCKN